MKYTVECTITISASAEVEASSKREALKKAQNLSLPDLCYQCESAGEYDDECWTLNGLDGDAQNITLVSDD